MAKVKVIASTIRYGSNGYKHKGDIFNLPDEAAREKANRGLVEILPVVKEEKAEKQSKELKEETKTK